MAEEVKVRLSPEGTREVVLALQKVREEANRAGRAGSSVGALSGAFSALRGLLPTLGLAAVAAGITAVARSAINAADEVGKAAQRVGTNAEAYSVLAFAARTADVSSEELQGGLIRLANTLDQARKGTGEQAEALAALGISQQELARLDTAQVFARVAVAIAKVPDPLRKTQLALDIFGRAGAKLIPLLNDLGTKGFAAARAEAAKFNAIISSDTAAAAQEFNDHLERMKASQQGLAIAFLSGILPRMNEYVAAVSEARRESGLLAAVWVALGGLGPLIFGNTDLEDARNTIANLQKAAAATRELIAQQEKIQRGTPAGRENQQRRVAGLQQRLALQERELAAARERLTKLQEADRARTTLNAQQQIEADRASAREALRIQQAKFQGLTDLEAQYASIAIRNRERILASDKAILDQLAKSAELRRTLATAQQTPAQRVETLRVEAVDAEGELRAAALAANTKDAVAAHQKLLALVKELKAAGGEGAEAMLDTADELLKLAQAAERIKLTDESKKAEEAAKLVRDQLRPIRAEIDKLSDQIEPVRVKLRLAEGEVEKFAEELAKQVIPIPVAPRVQGFASGGQVQAFAAGGRVRGFSPAADSDNIHALLTAGEYVLRVPAVRHYGADFLDALNRMQLPRFAEGGLVGDAGATAAGGGDVQVFEIRIGGRRTGRFTGSREDLAALAQGLQALESSIAGDY